MIFELTFYLNGVPSAQRYSGLSGTDVADVRAKMAVGSGVIELHTPDNTDDDPEITLIPVQSIGMVRVRKHV